jgi:hypothetical protein
MEHRQILFGSMSEPFALIFLTGRLTFPRVKACARNKEMQRRLSPLLCTLYIYFVLYYGRFTLFNASAPSWNLLLFALLEVILVRYVII